MTNEEAIKELKREFLGEWASVREAKDFAVSALEKQIPKKPKPIHWEQYKGKIVNAEYLRGGFWCPNCNHLIKSGYYCVDCGQRIRWEGDDKE